MKTAYAGVGTKSGVLQGVLSAKVAESRSIETLEQLPLAPDLESAMRLAVLPRYSITGFGAWDGAGFIRGGEWPRRR